MLSDDVETNEYAQMAIELENAIYLDKEQKKNSLLSQSMVAKKKSFCQRLSIKIKIIKENLSENVTYRFYGFLILKGLCMPSFADF